MRVELIYSPECDVYKSIRNVLEDVIAEERLPIPVEMVEDKVHTNSPSVRIDGHFLVRVKTSNTFEHLREIVQKKWAELNHFKI